MVRSTRVIPATMLVVAFLLCASVAFAAQPRGAPTSSNGTGWPQYGFDATHTSDNAADTTISTSNVATLVQAWSYPLGASNEAYNVLETGGLVYAGSQTGTLAVLNASTGALVWSFATGITGRSPVTASVAVDGGRVYTPCVRFSPTQAMCAFDAATGAFKWSFPLPGSESFVGAPAVAFGTVYFEGCTTVCAVYALDEKDGLVRWATLEPSTCLSSGDPPAIGGQWILGGMTCSGPTPYVYVAHVKDGSGLASLYAQGTVQSVSLGYQQIFVVAWSNQRTYLTAFSLGGLQTEWQEELATLTSTPAPALSAIADGYAFLSAAGQFQVHPHRSKKILWSVGSASAEAAVANGVLYTDWNGVAAALPAQTSASSPLWTAGGAPGIGAPIIADGAVYGACNATSVCKWTLPAQRRATRRNGGRP
jgi:outer membrane protein assembly factor BamB